jgi:hypothetical protein
VADPHDRRSALALSDAGGHGRVARVGSASAIVGQLIIAAAEVIWPSNRDLGDVLFSVSPILTGAGLVTAGVAIIRAGVWARPSRFLPGVPGCLGGAAADGPVGAAGVVAGGEGVELGLQAADRRSRVLAGEPFLQRLVQRPGFPASLRW